MTNGKGRGLPTFQGIRSDDLEKDGRFDAQTVSEGISRVLRTYFNDEARIPSEAEVAALEALLLNHGSRHTVPASPGGEDPIDVGRLFDRSRRLLTSIERKLLVDRRRAVLRNRALHGHGTEALTLPGGVAVPVAIYDSQLLPGTKTGAGFLSIFTTPLRGGSIGVQDILVFNAFYRRSTGAGNTTARVVLGGTEILNFGATALGGVWFMGAISCDGLSLSSQVASGSAPGIANSRGTAAIDLGLDQNLELQVDLATDTDVVEPLHYVLGIWGPTFVNVFLGQPGGPPGGGGGVGGGSQIGPIDGNGGSP